MVEGGGLDSPCMGDAGTTAAGVSGGARPEWAKLVLAHLVVLVGSIGVWSSIGGPHGPVDGLIAVSWPAAWGPVLAYALAIVGWGELVLRGVRLGGEVCDDGFVRWSLRLGLGAAVMLTLSHGLGVMGLLSAGAMWGSVVVGWVGVALVVREVARGVGRGEGGGWWWVAVQPVVGLLVTAAASPPGWLWESEARGYDALSYHLQLPKEWLEAGRVWPVAHNVYSYLPGYVEAAFVHVARLGGARVGDAGSYVGGDGAALVGAQLLHAVLGVMSVAAIAGSVRAVWPAARGGLCVLAGVVGLAVPWSIVTGSLAYNELGVALLGASAVTATAVGGVSPVRRGVIAAVLVGAACGCKPTALLFVAPVVGLVMLARVPWSVRAWAGMIAAGCVAGVVMLLPWLVRNELATGNAVFPFAARLLGEGHWSAEQLARYASGHHFDGSLVDRLRLMVIEDASDPAGPRHRGMMHPQWSVFLPVLAAAVVVAAWRGDRVVRALAVGLVVQVMAWLAFTHIQSRFLMPMVVPGVVVMAAVCGRARRGEWVMVAVGAVMLASSARVFVREPVTPEPGRPNQVLIAGPGLFTGEFDREGLADSARRGETLALLGPDQFVNVALEGEGTVVLVGGATPLYLTRRAMYATTWDVSPLAREMALSNDVGAWSAGLRAKGARWALVHLSELERLRRSGWLEPVMVKAIESGQLRAWMGRQRLVRAWPDAQRPQVVLLELEGAGR